MYIIIWEQKWTTMMVPCNAELQFELVKTGPIEAVLAKVLKS